MNTIQKLIINKVKEVRASLDMNQKCGSSLFSIIQEMNTKSNERIDLFRLPFKENNIAGFVGYKNDRFVIFTNTGKTLGYEVFTLAHELYHIIENRLLIKEETAILDYEDEQIDSDEVADMFAAELLMPHESIENQVKKELMYTKSKIITPALIIKLQQDYFVEYKAMTKRLKEIGIISEKQETELNSAIQGVELENLTQRLGYCNSLNIASNVVSLPKRYLLSMEENYKLEKINYDDLYVIFSYCNLSPEHFNYNKDDSLSKEAKEFMDEIIKELEQI